MSEPAVDAAEQSEPDPWTARFYPRGTAAFDRVVFFSDAVIAIAITLAAVEIGLPEAEDPTSPASLWAAIVAKGPLLAAYAMVFFWVGVYWKANHRFTNTLRRMSGRYITVTLCYLAFIALLPFTASTLGVYLDNPVAVALFAAFAATVSTVEIVLIVVAQRDDLYLRPMTAAQLRYQVWGASTPLPGFLLSIPVAFVSPWAAMLCWFVGSAAFGWLLGRRVPEPSTEGPARSPRPDAREVDS
jgi:uncharacterized membrane protein